MAVERFDGVFLNGINTGTKLREFFCDPLAALAEVLTRSQFVLDVRDLGREFVTLVFERRYR